MSAPEQVGERARAWADDIDVVISEDGADKRVAADRLHFEAARELESLGYELHGGTRVTDLARAVKSSDEIDAMLVPSLRRNRPRAARRAGPYARRLPKGRKAGAPGEIVQLDTLTVSPHPGQPAIKQFTACDPVAKWTCAQAWRRATAHNANVRRACAAPPGPRSRLTLDKLQADMPFFAQATSKPSRSTAAPSSRPTSKPNAGAEASRCSNSLPDRPNPTDTSSATTAPGDTSSTPHGTSPTTTSTASTDGSTPSPTSPTPSDHTRPLADKPQNSTLPNTQPTKPLHLIWPEPGHATGRRHDATCTGVRQV